MFGRIVTAVPVDLLQPVTFARSQSNSQEGWTVLVETLKRALTPMALAASRPLLSAKGDWRSALWARLDRYFLYTGAEVSVTTIFGSRMDHLRTNDFLQKHIAAFGQWEPAITRYLSDKLKPGDVFIDVGSNIGYYALLAHRRGAQVHAIEACPSIADLLQQTLDRNGAGAVSVHRVAVSDTEGSLEFFRAPANNIGSSSLAWQPGYISEGKVPARPLSKIVGVDVLARAKFIKIDVEGVEPLVIADLLANRLSDDVEILVEFAPSESDEIHREAFANLQRAGFQPYALQDEYSLREYLVPSKPHLKLLAGYPDQYADVLFRRALTPRPNILGR